MVVAPAEAKANAWHLHRRAERWGELHLAPAKIPISGWENRRKHGRNGEIPIRKLYKCGRYIGDYTAVCLKPCGIHFELFRMVRSLLGATATHDISRKHGLELEHLNHVMIFARFITFPIVHL